MIKRLIHSWTFKQGTHWKQKKQWTEDKIFLKSYSISNAKYKILILELSSFQDNGKNQNSVIQWMQNIIPYKNTSLTSYQVRIQCSPCHSQAEEPPSQKRWGEGSLTLRWGELPQGPRRIRSHHGLPHSALGLLLCRCLEGKKYIMDRQIKNVKKCIICIINCN